MVNTMRWKLTILWLFVSVYAAPVIRWRRQIVTPKHLMGPPLPTSFQGKVVITPQNLREVADLRATIHKAIDEDTYVVAAPPSQDAIPKHQFGFRSLHNAAEQMNLVVNHMH
ncbi:uncharacterized protein [Drosophila suzukii]|uniref:Uncharacterized protein isoform X2 n=1 Tax=Drosophila suzukii TaxID=28584 RepID=A0AB40DK34_DROSZ